jgi:hypothetical protein
VWSAQRIPTAILFVNVYIHILRMHCWQLVQLKTSESNEVTKIYVACCVQCQNEELSDFLPEKQIVSQVVKTSPSIYGTLTLMSLRLCTFIIPLIISENLMPYIIIIICSMIFAYSKGLLEPAYPQVGGSLLVGL